MTEPITPTIRGVCHYCNTSQTATLHIKATVSGAEQFCYVCDGCQRLNPFGGRLFIASNAIYAAWTKEDIQNAPILTQELAQRCAKCGHRFAEYHHWAPQAMFEDANEWPGDYLCKKCHDIWHNKVTPQLVKGANPELAEQT